MYVTLPGITNFASVKRLWVLGFEYCIFLFRMYHMGGRDGWWIIIGTRGYGPGQGPRVGGWWLV